MKTQWNNTSTCFHVLEWYLKDGHRYRCIKCGLLLKIASGRYPTEPKPMKLDFNTAWREAHNRQCEWEIRTGLCDAVICGRTIHANEYPDVLYCEKHAQE